MNIRWATAGLLMLVFASPISAETADKPADSLRCELRPNQQVLTTDPHSHLHFLLFSERDGLKVYEDWNYW